MTNDFMLSFTRTGQSYAVKCCRFGGLAQPVESYEPGAWQIDLPDGGQIVLMHFAPADLLSQEDGAAFEELIARLFDDERNSIDAAVPAINE